MFLIFVFAVCCLAFSWLILNFRRVENDGSTGKSDDREKTLEMLAEVGDRFSLSIYKKVYRIEDREIAEKRRRLKTENGY
jgi:hypothetical protein